MDDYLQALTEQLRVAGPRAIAILLDQAPKDATILMAAVEAASLLRDADWLPPADQALSGQVLDATGHTGPMAWLVSDALDLAGLAEPPDPGPALEAWLDHLVALAAISPYQPTGARRQLDVLLEESRARAFSSPALLAPLSQGAQDLLDALDLADDHPARLLLSDVTAANELAQVQTPVAALQARLSATAAKLAPLGSAPLRELVQSLRGGFDQAAVWLRGQLARPAVALADTDDVGPPPERHSLATLRDGELCLVMHGGAVLLEWSSEGAPAPVQVQVNGHTLANAPAIVQDSPCWTLVSPDDGPVRSLRLVFPDGSVEELAAPQ